MHTATHDDASQGAMFTAIDTAAEEERRRRIEKARGSREAAYERLKFGDTERAAMEWACPKHLNSNFRELRPFFDEAESLSGDEQVAAWLEGATFSEASVGKIRESAAVAVRLHEKHLRSVQFADRAENGILWFLRLALVGIGIFSIVHFILR